MAKAKQSASTDVIEVEAEEIEPIKVIEQHINQELVKNNVTEQVIGKLKADYMHLKIKGQDDRDGYRAVKEGRIACKGVRVLAEKICKKGREAAILEQKAWIAKEKEVASKIGEVEGYLSKQEDEYEAEKERIKQEQIQAEAKRLVERTTQLKAIGVEFNGADYVLDEIAFSQAEVREMDDDLFLEHIYSKFHAKWQQKEGIRIAEEKRLAEIQEQQRLQEEAIKKREEELKQKEAEIAKAEAEALRKQKEIEEKERIEKKRIQDELQNKRFEALYPYSKFGAYLDLSLLWTLQEDSFNDILESKKALHEKHEAEQAEIRAKKQEEEKQAAIAQALAEEKQRQEESRAKAEHEKQMAELKKQQELEQAGDKAQWQHFISELQAIKVPTAKSGTYRNKVSLAKEKISEIINA